MALEDLSRAQLIDLINAETGESRRFVGYAKKALIDRIHGFQDFSPPASNLSDHLAPLSATAASRMPLPARRMKQIDALGSPSATRCANAACRAQLEPGSDFCKRCSCWICRKYDDNKDTSLWLVCDNDNGVGSGSNAVASPLSCGLSCHIHCAIHKGGDAISDCAYRCLSCGARTGLLGRVKKLLAQATAARRVDVLHERLVISTKCLSGSAKDGKYGKCAEIVQSALDKLAQEIGPFSKGLVSRLASAPEVLGLTKRTLECLEVCDVKTHTPDPIVSVFQIQFKEITTSSVQLAVAMKSHDETSGRSISGYRLWHRRSRGYYSAAPTVTILTHQKALVTNLDPGTGYMFKAVAFSAKGDEGVCETRCYTKRLEPSFASGGRRHKVQVVEVVQVEGEDGVLADTKAVDVEACSVDCKEKGGSEPEAPVSLPLQSEKVENPVQEPIDVNMVSPEEKKTCTLLSVPAVMDMDLNLSPKDVEQASLSDIDAQPVTPAAVQPPQTMENVQMATACEMNTYEDGALLDFKPQETCPVYLEEKCSNERETTLPLPRQSPERDIPENKDAVVGFSEEKKTSSSSDSAVLDMELNSSSNDAVQAKILPVQQNCAIVQYESSWQTRGNAQLDNACETKNLHEATANAEPEKTPFRACSLRVGNLLKISESVRKLTAKVTPKSSTNETSSIAETLYIDPVETTALTINTTETTDNIVERVDTNTAETTANIPDSANINGMEPAGNIADAVNTKTEDANLLSVPDNSNINSLRATSCQWMVPHPVEEPCDVTPPTKALTADTNPVSRKRKREKTAIAIKNNNSRENAWRWTDKTFEHCVKILRWLECQGHVKSEFRMRFLTWLGLKATDQQRRVISIYIQSMMDDPVSLAEQLVDAFEEATKRNS